MSDIETLPAVLHWAAQAHADDIALRCEDAALSYAGWESASNRLARALRDAGADRGDRVGLMVNKGMRSGIGIYGIMKSGAAYVPIDPRARPAQVEYIVRKCAIRHLVCEPDKAASLEGTGLETAIGLEPGTLQGTRCVPWPMVEQMPATAPPVALRGADIAYIMFTSGSTGTPKGIVHTHDSGLAYARAAADLYAVTSSDVLSNHSHLHFDMSTFDFFSGPLRGACTVILTDAHMRFPASLVELIEKERISIWYSVTTALVELLTRGDLAERDLDCLRWVIFGGEVFPPDHLHALMRLLPRARFSNIYGPAECNGCAWFHVPPLPNAYRERPVPIGRALADAELLVVDDDGAVGEEGELLVNARTNMQGYWDDPARTAAAFEEREQNGAVVRYLKTGDLVRRGQDGNLEYLGRRDRQVKLRGFRVELDGVEAVLGRHPAVVECAVWMADDKSQLYAAVLAAPGDDAIDGRALGRYLGQHLPAYAVPRTIRLVTEMPRTGSGKIDRRALARESAVAAV